VRTWWSYICWDGEWLPYVKNEELYCINESMYGLGQYPQEVGVPKNTYFTYYDTQAMSYRTVYYQTMGRMYIYEEGEHPCTYYTCNGSETPPGFSCCENSGWYADWVPDPPEPDTGWIPCDG
jgi:hypothetical protein